MSDHDVGTANLTRSCNEAVIMSLLEKGPLHGYQLALESERLGGTLFAFKHGTLYPILHSMEKRGLIEGVWHGKKKAYTITTKGREFRDLQKQSWMKYLKTFLRLIDGEIL